MIEVNNLIKKFDDFYALNGVNMNVGEGDIYGLVGRMPGKFTSMGKKYTKTEKSSQKLPIFRTNCFIFYRQIRWK